MFVVVQSSSCVQLFATPWTAACQASLSFTISQSLPKSCPLCQWCHPTISSSDALFSFCLQSFPVTGSFPMSQLFASDDQNTRPSVSVLPTSIQGWFPLRLTRLISLLSKGLQDSSPAPQFKGINSLALCFLYGPVFTNILNHWEDHAAAAESLSVESDSVQPTRQPTRLPLPWDSPGKNTRVGCHFLLQCMKVKSESEVAQLCLTLSDPMDYSPPGSSIHGIFQARVVEWGAIALALTIWTFVYAFQHSL